MSASHSACQAPAARWCSWTSEPVSTPDAAAAPRAQATASTDETGLRLCGIVDETPCPEPAASATSPTSVWASSVMSRPIFPQAPASAASAAPSSATRTRLVCHGSVGSREPELAREVAGERRPVGTERAERAGGASELRREPLRAHAFEPRRRVEQTDEPTRRDEPERRRRRPAGAACGPPSRSRDARRRARAAAAAAAVA